MSQPKLEIDGFTIVLVGSFNCQIFQPAWFASQGLIRKEESEAAKVRVIHPEIAAFELDWCSLEVTTDRFSISTTQEPSYPVVRDLALGTFRILRHTPVRALGLNREMHFLMPSEEAWHALGHRVAPKEPWEGILHKPGMLTLSMKGERQDKYTGYIQVRIEPSVRVHPGVFIHINDHYKFKEEEFPQGTEGVINIIGSNYDNSLIQATRITKQLLGLS